MNKYFMAIPVLITLLGLIIEPEPSWGGNELPNNSFVKKYEYLIPEDATLVEYDPHRFALVSGAIISEDGVELAGVNVTILNKPEYGSVLTNDDGKFLLPVEGGGNLTVVFEKYGYTTAHHKCPVIVN
ncbi:MAG: hypothetical protein CSB34_06625 [Desulfobulbus propionicus]|nr:MAG: hypothetical protein CSB34_06625 [Desulfobulbus propionicus]